MTEPFIGQIQPFGFNFAPKNWALCNGQILPIAQNSALFSLLGAVYGGNGTTTFALPNLQSRVPMHMGDNLGTLYPIGEVAGVETVTLTTAEMPAHIHFFMGTTQNGDSATPTAGTLMATAIGGADVNYYGPDTTPQPLNSNSIGPVGGSQPHSNIQPYLTINWCIALSGIFPSRN